MRKISKETKAIILGVLILLIGIGTMKYGYNVLHSTEIPNGYTLSSIEIEKGDTLSSIADNIIANSKNIKIIKRNLINEITRINGINSDTIHYGNYLIVPEY